MEKNNTRKKSENPSFGIIIDTQFIEEWHQSIIENILKFDTANLVLIIHLNSQTDFENNKNRSVVLDNFISKPVNFLYLLLGKKNSIKKILRYPNIQILKPDSSISNNSVITINSDQIESISDINIQFILNLSSYFVNGDILDVPQFGVWSFHHHDQIKIAKIPICCHEMQNNATFFDCYLKKISKNDDAFIVKHSRIKLFSHSYKKNIKNINNECGKLIKLAIKDITTNSLKFTECDTLLTNTIKNGDICQKSENSFKFTIKLLKNYIFFVFDLFFYHDLWAVVIVDKPIPRFLENVTLNEYQYLLKNEKFGFYVDPFGIFDGQNYILACEFFNYFDGAGKIALFKIEKNLLNCEKIKTIAFHDCHQSYPFLFKLHDEYYCLPEIANTNKILIYKANNALLNDFHEELIFDNFQGLDPTMIFYNDIYWIFCSNAKDYLTNALYIFYSSSINGPWIPHILNPVKMDICSSRPAGTPFIYKNTLYRPAQDCSATYGGRIVINKILELSLTQFEEEIVSIIEPNNTHEYSKGIHTISEMGAFTLFDVKKRVFSITLFIIRAKNIFKRKLFKKKYQLHHEEL